MVFTVILAGVAGGLFGCLIGMTIITVRDVIGLERDLTDERLRCKRTERDRDHYRWLADRWRAKAIFLDETLKLHRRVEWGLRGQPEEPGQPPLQLVTDDADPAGWYAAKKWERAQEEAQ